MLSADAVKAAARDCRFTLVGLTPAVPLDPGPLERWLAAGYAADMDWMARRLPERLDPAEILPGARTVIALAIAYHRPAGEGGPVARYARGRDYHYAHRDRMKALRRRLLALDPGVETYAAVDTGPAMEKVWAERAGLGWIGKNGCLIHPRLGSWLTLSVMFVDREVDAYDAPAERRCGDCALCLGACPTGAFAAPGVVDARGPASRAGSSAATSARRSARSTGARPRRGTRASRPGRWRAWRRPRWRRSTRTPSDACRRAWPSPAPSTTACAGTPSTPSARPAIGGRDRSSPPSSTTRLRR